MGEISLKYLLSGLGPLSEEYIYQCVEIFYFLNTNEPNAKFCKFNEIYGFYESETITQKGVPVNDITNENCKKVTQCKKLICNPKKITVIWEYSVKYPYCDIEPNVKYIKYECDMTNVKTSNLNIADYICKSFNESVKNITDEHTKSEHFKFRGFKYYLIGFKYQLIKNVLYVYPHFIRK